MKILKPTEKNISIAAEILRNGGLVAFPTETVYGLGANALNEEAVKKIFRLKNRPRFDPLIIHIANKRDIYKYVKRVPEKAGKLIKKFWPGPLTIILPKKNIVPDIVTSGLKTVAIRMPSNRIANKLIKKSGVPVAAPSANIFSRPSSTEVKHILKDFRDRISVILDGGRTEYGLESTVIDLSGKNPNILRPGMISSERLNEIIPVFAPRLNQNDYNKKKIKSPGLLKKHYSPAAKVFIFRMKEKDLKRIMEKIINNRGHKFCFLIFSDFPKGFDFSEYKVFKKKLSLNKLAYELFSFLRQIDKVGYNFVFVESIKKIGLGAAIMDRLEKAGKYI